MTDKEKDKILLECFYILIDLTTCGTFYDSAIEIDTYECDSGEDFEKRIDDVLLKLKYFMNTL